MMTIGFSVGLYHAFVLSLTDFFFFFYIVDVGMNFLFLGYV